jgi:hypothetical protein
VSVDLVALGDAIPGGGPTDRLGPVIVVPVATTTVDQNILTGDCNLLGWSFRESTGLGGAVAELIDGGDNNGSLAGCIDLTAGFDPAASQSPQANTAAGANSIATATIGGGAGTLVFVTSLRIEGLGATGATEVQAVLAGVLGGAITYPVTVPAGVAVAIPAIEDQFGGRGLQASAVAQAITLTLPAFGAGNTFSEVELQGYIQTAAGAADTQWLGDSGIYIQVGLRLRVVSGSIRGSLWIRR